MNRIKSGINLNLAYPLSMLFISFFEPCECFVFCADADTNQSEVDRLYIPGATGRQSSRRIRLMADRLLLLFLVCGGFFRLILYRFHLRRNNLARHRVYLNLCNVAGLRRGDIE